MSDTSGLGEGQIVVGVDGTAASAAAVRWAVEEARLRQAGVRLVFAYDDEPGRHAPYAGRPGARPDEDDALPRALFDAERQASWTMPKGPLCFELVHGSPARVLIDRSAGADLLVLGSAYRPGQPASGAPPVMGPVARACLHGAACPVVFVVAARAPGKPSASLMLTGRAL